MSIVLFIAGLSFAVDMKLNRTHAGATCFRLLVSMRGSRNENTIHSSISFQSGVEVEMPNDM